MIELILPSRVSVAETIANPSLSASLHAAEAALIRGAAASRQAEFAIGRSCAHQALARLGAADAPVGRGPGGEPQWPAGVTGSITHCAGYCAAVVAWQDSVRALGIDAEPHAPLPGEVVGYVATEAETRLIGELTITAPGVHWDMLLFCAKEAVYKACFPARGRSLTVKDTVVTMHPCGRFTAALPAGTGPQAAVEPDALSGRWLIKAGLVLTAVAVLAVS